MNLAAQDSTHNTESAGKSSLGKEKKGDILGVEVSSGIFHSCHENSCCLALCEGGPVTALAWAGNRVRKTHKACAFVTQLIHLKAKIKSPTREMGQEAFFLFVL